MNRRKTPQSSNALKKSKKKKFRSWHEIQYLYSGRLKPAADGTISHFARELVEWAEQPENLVFKQFLCENRISQKAFENWLKRSEELREAKQYALMVLAARREHGAIKKDFDPSFVKFTLPLYDPDYKKLEEWRASLKKDDDDESETKVVVLEKFGKEYKKLG